MKFSSSTKSRCPDPASTAMAAIAGLVMTSVILIAAPVANAEEVTAQTATLTVTVTGIQSPQGTLRIGLFDEAGYESDDAINGANVDVDADTQTATIEGLAPGTYGIKMYHDVDGDGEMNTNPFGMPTEPFAFSNNARGRFGPATWAAASFDVPAGMTTHTITIE